MTSYVSRIVLGTVNKTRFAATQERKTDNVKAR